MFCIALFVWVSAAVTMFGAGRHSYGLAGSVGFVIWLSMVAMVYGLSEGDSRADQVKYRVGTMIMWGVYLSFWAGIGIAVRISEG